MQVIIKIPYVGKGQPDSLYLEYANKLVSKENCLSSMSKREEASQWTLALMRWALDQGHMILFGEFSEFHESSLQTQASNQQGVFQHEHSECFQLLHFCVSVGSQLQIWPPDL